MNITERHGLLSKDKIICLGHNSVWKNKKNKKHNEMFLHR